MRCPVAKTQWTDSSTRRHCGDQYCIDRQTWTFVLTVLRANGAHITSSIPLHSTDCSWNHSTIPCMRRTNDTSVVNGSGESRTHNLAMVYLGCCGVIEQLKGCHATHGLHLLRLAPIYFVAPFERHPLKGKTTASSVCTPRFFSPQVPGRLFCRNGGIPGMGVAVL